MARHDAYRSFTAGCEGDSDPREAGLKLGSAVWGKRRGTRRGARALAVVASASLVALGLVAVPPAQAALPSGGMTGAALTSLFDTYGDTSGQWSGGDSTVSIL